MDVSMSSVADDGRNRRSNGWRREPNLRIFLVWIPVGGF